MHLFYNTYGNGANDAVCHAVSKDGLHFERDITNPILRAKGDWNSGRAIDIDLLEHSGKLLLYFATRDPEGKIQMLAVAESGRRSGFGRDTWRQLGDGPVLRPQLPWETNCIEAPSVVERNGWIYLFYGGGYNNDPQQIGCARSRDGIHFERLFRTPLLPNGNPGSWNSSESGHPGYFADDDGKGYLFYQGNNDHGRTWLISFVRLTWVHGIPQIAIRPAGRVVTAK